MAALEALIYSALTGDAVLAGLLAVYGGRPAVFEVWAPDSSDAGWQGEQTPRVEFSVVRQEDPERRVAGQVAVTVIDERGSMDRVAQVEARIRAILDGATFRPDEGTVSLRWARADAFEQEPDLRGVEAVFDLIAWPAGLTYAPDPVAAMRAWSQARWPTLQVDPAAWTPSDAAPAIYWRASGIVGVQQVQWGAWVRLRLQAHVLAQSPGVRLAWIRRVVEALAVDRGVDMGDGSRLRINAVSADSLADPLRVGQISVEATMGVLRPEAAAVLLNRAVVSGAVTGEVR